MTVRLLDYDPPADLLRDKCILITGAASGIGRAVARSFADHGASLVLLALLPVVAISLAAGCASAPVSGVQPDGSFRETFEAFAVSMGTSHPPVIPPGTNAIVQVNITRWTTP